MKCLPSTRPSLEEKGEKQRELEMNSVDQVNKD